jgi:hypothetical protein
MIEIGITHGFAVEFDAVYHRQGFFSAFYHDTVYYTSRERDNSWEFPLLLQYNLRFPVLHPFVEAGVAPRTISGRYVQSATSDLFGPVPPQPFGPSMPLSYSPSVGFVAGGGFQFNLGHLRLAPQVRYSRSATRVGRQRRSAEFITLLDQPIPRIRISSMCWSGSVGKLDSSALQST